VAKSALNAVVLGEFYDTGLGEVAATAVDDACISEPNLLFVVHCRKLCE